jgi:hypothetical protein
MAARQPEDATAMLKAYHYQVNALFATYTGVSDQQVTQ